MCLQFEIGVLETHLRGMVLEHEYRALFDKGVILFGRSAATLSFLLGGCDGFACDDVGEPVA